MRADNSWDWCPWWLRGLLGALQLQDSPDTTMQHNSQPSTHGEWLLSLSHGALGFLVTLALS